MRFVKYVKSILRASNKMDFGKQAVHSIFAHSRRASSPSVRLRQPASPSLAALGLPKPQKHYALPAFSSCFFRGHQIAFSIVLSFMLLIYSTGNAGITLDGSFGTSGALTGPNYTINSNVGKQVGGNLFHSFGSFNLKNTESATFMGPANVENIISRVTGGQASNIDGLLKSDIQGANFYFINPSGIVFGQNARLDVSGSFHASTADYLKLGDTGRVDASQPDNSLLSSAPPSAFGFLGPGPAGIDIQGSFLQVPEGKVLSIAGGNLDLENSYLYAPGGRINIAAVASAGEVVFDGPDLVVDSFEKLGELNVLHNIADRVKTGETFINNIDASGTGGGSLFIRAGKFVVDNGWVAADTYGEKDGVGIDVKIKDEMTVSNNSLITSDTYSTGKGGDITMETGSLNLTGGGTIEAATFNAGDTGEIVINTGTLSLIGGGGITTNSQGSGNGGNLTINASEGILISGHDNVGQSAIYSNAFSSGNGGIVNISASSLALDEGGVIQAVTNESGNAGGILINTGKLSIAGGAGITTNSEGIGNGGNLTINASKSILISGDDANGPGSIYSNTFSSGNGGKIGISTPSLIMKNGGLIQAMTEGSGNAGEININTGSLAITGGAQINTSSNGSGNGGNISIYASDSMNLSGYQDSGENLFYSAIFSNASGSGYGGYIYIETPFLKMSNLGTIQAAAYGPGDSGYVLVETEKLIMSGGANIDTSSYGEGLGGYLMIKAKDYVGISGNDSGLYSNSTGAGVGGFIYVASPVVDISNGGGAQASTFDAGSGEDVSYILMEVGKLTLSNGGFIDSSSYGQGTGGYLLIVAKDSVNITGKFSGLYSSSEGSGPGGLIYVSAPLLDISDSGTIDARTSDTGTAGDIVAEVGSLKLKDNSSISVQSIGTGLAGNIVIYASDSVELRDSSMTAATENADGGNIYINAKKLLYMKDSSLTATVKGGTGNGGNIFIDPENVVLDRSRIIANAEGGNGGNISIVAENYFPSPSSTVSASSRLGVDGTVVISSPAIDITGNLSVLTASFLKADVLFPKPCAAGEEEMSSFVIKGRDGLPALPDSLR